MPSRQLNIFVRLRDFASKGVKSLRRDITGLGKAGSSAVKGISAFNAALTTVIATAAGGALFGKSVKDFADFDDNMRAAAAVTHATDAELRQMTNTALELGKTTRFTARQSAEAFTFLGMAGLEASESIQALPNVLNLAAAGALDLGTAADITTNIMSGFGLQAKDLSRVNDDLVQTFTSSNTNLIEIGEAFKLVGPIAKGVGANFEDLVGTIGALGNAGIKGTLAGTALKNAIDALLAPSGKEAAIMKDLAARIGQTSLEVKDASGDFIGFRRVIEQLEKAGLRGDEALKAFGLRAGPALQALLNQGSDALDELVQKVIESDNVSEEIARKREAGLGGQIRRTISVLESFRLEVGKAFGPEVIEFLKVFNLEVSKIIGAIQRLAEDGSLDGFGEAAIKVLKAARFVFLRFVKETDAAIERLKILISVGNALWNAFNDLIDIIPGARKALDGFVESTNNVLDKATQFDGAVVKPITAEMNATRKALEDAAKSTGPIGKGASKVGDSIVNKIVEFPNIETKLKASLIRLNALLRNEAANIESQYKQGLVSLDEYYDDRESIVRRRAQKELEILRKNLETETDVNKKELLNAQIIAKEQELQTTLLKLNQERVEKQKELDQTQLREKQKLNNARLKAEKARSDQEARIKEEGTTTLDSEFARELAQLQTKQNNELQTIRNYYDQRAQLLLEHNATKEELDRLYREKKAALDEQVRLQTQEREQQAADQALRLQEYKLDNLKQLASGTANLFSSVYDTLGKKNKAFFYIAKAAAIAEATINIAQGITKAIAQGGVLGIAQGALVAAAGAVQITKIASQGLAGGGEVKGRSPHKRADDKLIRATSGEYVMNVDSVRHYGAKFMEDINKRRFAYGGQVPSDTKRYRDGGSVTGGPNTSANQQMPVNIINVVDPSTLDQYLATPSGQDAVLNVIGQRSQEVQRRIKSGA